MPLLKKVKLPESADQWKAANDYFQASLSIDDIASSSLNTIINRINKIIYEHFEINFGLVNSVKRTEINNKCKGYSKHGLKFCLKQLKREGADQGCSTYSERQAKSIKTAFE